MFTLQKGAVMTEFNRTLIECSDALREAWDTLEASAELPCTCGDPEGEMDCPQCNKASQARYLKVKAFDMLTAVFQREIPVVSAFTDKTILGDLIKEDRLQQMETHAEEGGKFPYPASTVLELIHHIRAVEKVRDEWCMEYVRLRDAPKREIRTRMPIETAPKDGTRILLWVEHENLKHAKGEDRKRWHGWCIGKWSQHNGGGWTHDGMFGQITGWGSLPEIEDETT